MPEEEKAALGALRGHGRVWSWGTDWLLPASATSWGQSSAERLPIRVPHSLLCLETQVAFKGFAAPGRGVLPWHPAPRAPSS